MPFPKDANPEEWATKERFPSMREFKHNTDHNFLWVDSIVGGSIPNNFLPAVEKGFVSMLAKGALIGAPVTGVRVTINDGASHPVDSSDIAFQEAARGAWRDTYPKMAPRILEPLMNALEVGSEGLRRTVAAVVGMTVITFLHISVGEQAPKWLAIQKPLPTTLWVAYPMVWFYYLSYPFVMALNWSSQWLLRQVGLEAGGEGDADLRLFLEPPMPGPWPATPSMSSPRAMLLS